MRALTVAALSDDLSGTALIDVPDPVRRPGQLLVRVTAASLNYPDLLMTRGAYQLKPPLPFVPGMEVAGEVVEADALALPGAPFRPGDRIVCGTRLSGFADLVAVDAAAARPIPTGMDDAEAAAFGAAYGTAYTALVRIGGLEAGDWVLVHGASGGVGLAACDLARTLGARVIATSRSPDKRDAVRRLCAPEAVLPANGFREAVKDLTAGGADLVYDPVGGDLFDESTRCIAFGGRLLVVGFTSGRIPTIPANIPLIKGFSVVGVRAGEYGRRFPERGREDRDTVWRLASEGRVRPHVHARIPLSDWRAAFETMALSRHVGKIVLIP